VAVAALCLCAAARPCAAAGPVRAVPHFPGYPTVDSLLRPPLDLAAAARAPGPEALAIAAAARGLPPEAQLRAVSAAVNAAGRWREDEEDRWLAPAEFLRDGGDCEDFAVAKFAVLSQLGWPADRMWVVAMRESPIQLAHAVLVVMRGDEAEVLDSLSDAVAPLSALDWYRPAYSVGPGRRWSHYWPLPEWPAEPRVPPWLEAPGDREGR
jgi:predicted transglutaminase-like cysteine proteinase